MDIVHKCNGGQKGPWCGKPAVFVVTQGRVPAKHDWERLQWFTCADHTEGNATEPLEEFLTRVPVQAGR